MNDRSLISMLALASGACALLSGSAVAFAQARSAACKPTETQPECHARLNCKSDEDLEECQQRLRRGNRRDDREDSGRRRDRGDDRRHRSDRDDGSDWDRSDRDRGHRSARSRSRRYRGDRGRRDRRGGGRAGGFQTNKTFGLGLELGAPVGLNGKYFVSADGALDFGIGQMYRYYYYDDGLHLYLGYLWHPVVLASTATLELPFYVGIGGRVWDFEFCEGSVCYDGSAVGLRVPLGFSFDFNEAPLDIFIQLVPVIDFITDDYYDRFDDRAHFGIDASAGIRYWFN